MAGSAVLRSGRYPVQKFCESIPGQARDAFKRHRKSFRVGNMETGLHGRAGLPNNFLFAAWR
jgi:hypothetical protein